MTTLAESHILALQIAEYGACILPESPRRTGHVEIEARVLEDIALALTAERAEVARLIGVLKEYKEADINDGLSQERLKAVNDRADVLYRQWETDRDNAELHQRRGENLNDCLRLADVAAQARRRKEAARQAIKATLTDAALIPPQEASMEGICDICGQPMPPGEEMFKFHGYSGPCPPQEAR